MKRSAPLIVIRRGVLIAGLAAAVLITILAYLLGRAGIGLSGPGPFASGADLREAVRDREATIRELRRGAAELDTLRAGQTLERRELSRTVESLQAEVARQRQQLQVYERGDEPCRQCGTPIRQRVQAQRSTYWCTECQH